MSLPHSLEIVLALLGVVFMLETAARRIEIPSPFLLLPAGILLSFIKHFPRITLDPDLVLYVFLPLLVYSGSALGSWGDFRKSIRPITFLSIGCVLFTTVIIAAAAHYGIPNFSWAAGFVLGAIVSPPDEVAAISIARRLGIPKRLSSVLEGEGLVNDATALTVYRVAAIAVVTHTFSFMHAISSFTLVVSCEIVWGLLVGWTMLRLRRILRNTSLEISMSLMTPFIAYLPAEYLGGTGVLATVTAGLYVSSMNPQFVRATTRLPLVPIWEIIEFVLDGILFLVTGLQLHGIISPLTQIPPRILWGYAVAISVLVIAARFLWVFPSTYFPRMVSACFRAHNPAPRWPIAFLLSWSGMRGAISLAAALSIPLYTSVGAAFPQRDLMIFLTFCVIVSTLVLQGLSLPALIRFFHIDQEGRHERAEAGHLEIEARRQAAEAALAMLSVRRQEGAYPEALLDRLEDQYRYRTTQFRAHLDGDHDGAIQHGTHRFNLQTELIETERQIILKLRKNGLIDDGVLRRVERDLDLQEMRLRQGISEWNLYGDEHESAGA